MKPSSTSVASDPYKLLQVCLLFGKHEAAPSARKLLRVKILESRMLIAHTATFYCEFLVGCSAEDCYIN